MALGKYSRIDNRQKSSNYCSTFTIVAFVAICLVGVWLTTSSTPVTPTMSSTEKGVEVKETAAEKIEPEPKSFDDTQVNLPDDATKGDEGDSLTGQSTENQEAKSDFPVEKKPETEKEQITQSGTSEEASKSEIGFNPDDVKKPNSDDASKDFEKNVDDDSKSGNGSSSTTDADSKSDNSSSSEEDSKPDNTSSPDGDSKPDNTPNSDGDSKADKTSNSGDGSKADVAEESNNGGGDYAAANSDKVVNSDSGADNAENNKASDTNSPSDSVSSGAEGSGESETKTADNSANVGKDDAKLSSEEVLPSSAQAELLNETTTQTGSWSTQVVKSKEEKESQSSSNEKIEKEWKLCNTSAGADFIPCLDNKQGIKSLPSTKHYEHRERHCPLEPPTCLVPLPEGYKTPIQWPQSRDKIWYKNVPHTQLAEYKGHQNWVKVTGDYLTFPGGGTQFTHGALHYIDFINDSLRDLKWGKRTRVILDVGCGVASFGGFLFERDVLTMSFAPKDEHEAQVQFALERGIPAFSAVMGTKRLPFPAMVFDAIHCARCRVPWHIEGGKLLLELNRVLRPGGFFIWSATPVYQRGEEDQAIWKAMKDLTKSMCWEMVSINKDKVNGVGIATFRKPSTNDCYNKRELQSPPLCPDEDNRNAAWNVPLQSCMHKVPEGEVERGAKWPEQWPERLGSAPYWMSNNASGVFGKPEVDELRLDASHWQRVVSKSYLTGMGIDWKTVRNVMDMRAIYGGFAAALKGQKVWVLNVVPVNSADTLPVIYERGLFGMYHDWCESFSTYPRTYDLLHADNLFSLVKKSCGLNGVLFEVDRIVRPGGKLIVRDTSEVVEEVELLMKSLRWETRMVYYKNNDGLLLLQKSMWRPSLYETLPYAI